MTMVVETGNHPINVLFLASEADPFIKVGGLGDVAGSLPLAIHNQARGSSSSGAVDIRLAIPFYPKLKEKLGDARKVASFALETVAGPVLAEVFSTTLSGITVYLVSGEPIDRNPAVYGPDYVADTEKFVFFSLACLQIPKALKWKIDILHLNDWHTAVAAHSLGYLRLKDKFLASSRSVLSVHNLPFMGNGSEAALRKYLVPPSDNKGMPDWARYLPLPMGLAAADEIVAVSPTYAKEMLKPEYGCGLQDFLSIRKQSLTGILNGLNLKSWDPSTDPEIHTRFTNTSLEERSRNKEALQEEFGLEKASEIPLLILISRMDHQKGIDIAIEGLRLAKELPWQAILLGSGHSALEEACKQLQKDLPHKVRAAIQFDTRLSRRMYAGGDILMMPSRYEPCGLAQMIAMRYGCIPMARATGGLVDSIRNSTSHMVGTGFLFKPALPSAFVKTLKKAILTFSDAPRWEKMQHLAMKQDFSWSKSANEYLGLYRSLKSVSTEVLK